MTTSTSEWLWIYGLAAWIAAGIISPLLPPRHHPDDTDPDEDTDA